MSVVSLLSGARGAGLLLTIDWEIPNAFLLASGQLCGPHKCWWGWNGSTAWCLLRDLWNVPSKRILRLRGFLRWFSVPRHYVKPASFSSVFTQEFALVCHSWSVLLEVCFIDLVPLSLPHCPHWWNHSLRTDSICFENRNFYTDRKSTTSNSESRIALQAKNVWTRCVHTTVGAVTPTLKQYEPEAVKCGCQHLYFSRHDRPLKPWWV